jgi:hypothetical protein
MKTSHRSLMIALTLALGLGVWGVAVNYTPATTFSDGNILTAAQLNAEFAAIQTAVASKLDLSGGTLTGRTDVLGTALNTGVEGDLSTVLNVRNLGNTGSAAVFRAQASTTNGDPVVSIKGSGTGPALSVKNANANGSLIAASNNTGVRFAVESDGSIRVGNLGADGTGAPTLRINAANGTIQNNVGSGLPLAYGTVGPMGDKVLLPGASTDNWDSGKTANGKYTITIDGTLTVGSTTVVTPRVIGDARIAVVMSSVVDGQLTLQVETYNRAGTLVDTGFNFVTFKSGF